VAVPAWCLPCSWLFGSDREDDKVTDKKTWFITGAGRGMGVDIAKAALAAGNAVVASGRNPKRVSAAIGAHDDLLAVKLDVTDPADAQAAPQAAVERFGRIDVLVNNESTNYAQPSIDDYAERTTQTVAAWNAMNGQQGGDPAKLADAVATVEQKAKDLLAQADAYPELSSLAYSDTADH
jgi:NAD(P)-dependent dehydrogenase (short-subunit alcohol dehydrogenase family)